MWEDIVTFNYDNFSNIVVYSTNLHPIYADNYPCLGISCYFLEYPHLLFWHSSMEQTVWRTTPGRWHVRGEIHRWFNWIDILKSRHRLFLNLMKVLKMTDTKKSGIAKMRRESSTFDSCYDEQTWYISSPIWLLRGFKVHSFFFGDNRSQEDFILNCTRSQQYPNLILL